MAGSVYGNSTILVDLEVAGNTLSVDATNNRVGVGLSSPKTALTVEGPVTLKEQANADGDTAAYGQLWVKTATPNELYFTTDAGNDIQITSGTSIASGGGGTAADDISTGDAAVTIATSSGNITLDAQAGDTDIIFKGTDGVNDITALTLDMSEAGAASFNAAVTVGTDLTVTGGDIAYGATNSTLAVGATAHDAAGATLSISGGAPTAGTSNNQAGGSVTISGGQGKGSGAGGDIVFKTANAGSSGSSLNALATALTISDDLSSTFGGDVVVGGATPTLTIGDAGAEDTMLVFDGNAQDFRIGLDDGTDTLEIGQGSSHGGNTAIAVNSTGQVITFNIPAAAVAQASDHIIFLDGGATGAPKAESIDDFLTAIAGTGISVSSSQLTAAAGSAADDESGIIHAITLGF